MNEESLNRQFTEILEIDSESGEEREIADYLIEHFSKMDVETIEDDSAKITGHDAGNLLIRIKGTSNAAPVYFTDHMDTVTPGNGIKQKTEDGYIVSDGMTILGSDDKA